jgi:8-oxo-dGTP pyrophosphatase MutT (NUDIX family)
MVDFKHKDYRAFVFVVHAVHGMMLLECTRKVEKGTHFQLPGGHVDEHEFVAAGTFVQVQNWTIECIHLILRCRERRTLILLHACFIRIPDK